MELPLIPEGSYRARSVITGNDLGTFDRTAWKRAWGSRFRDRWRSWSCKGFSGPAIDWLRLLAAGQPDNVRPTDSLTLQRARIRCESGSVTEDALEFTNFQWVTFHLAESRLLGQVENKTDAARRPI